MKAMPKLVTAMIAATVLAACASAPEPLSGPHRYSGVLLIWFEGQSFRADGQTEPWAFGMSPEAMRDLADAYPEGYAPQAMHTTIVAHVEGVLRPVDADAHSYGCVGGCYDHYLTITRVVEARLLRSACEPISRQVYFGSNEAALDASAVAIIDDAVREARQGACNVSSISIIGHADGVGSAIQNLELSEARAGAVRDALLARGVEAALMITEGAGEERSPHPTAGNAAEPINRVVEITFEAPTGETP